MLCRCSRTPWVLATFRHQTLIQTYGHGSKARTRSENPIPTKIGSKMGGEFTYQPKWDPIGFDPHLAFSEASESACLSHCHAAAFRSERASVSVPSCKAKSCSRVSRNSRHSHCKLDTYRPQRPQPRRGETRKHAKNPEKPERGGFAPISGTPEGLAVKQTPGFKRVI